LAQQTMRGVRLGTQSLESDVGVSYSPRTKYQFLCPNGHSSEIVFAQDAEMPETWQCKSCNARDLAVQILLRVWHFAKGRKTHHLEYQRNQDTQDTLGHAPRAQIEN